MAANLLCCKQAFEVDMLLTGLLVALQLFDRDFLLVFDAHFNYGAWMLVCVSGVRSVSLTFALCESLFGWPVWLRI